jgi:hypothetical protein
MVIWGGRKVGEGSRSWPPTSRAGSYLGLGPTLALPVMPNRKLKVRRREEPAQVPESPSSWL